MKKRVCIYYILVLFLVVSFCGGAQNTLDSLISDYKDQKDLRQKATSGLNLSWEYRRAGELKKALVVGREVVALCKANNFKELEANAYNRIANFYDDLSDYDSARYFGKAALELHLQLKKEKDVASDYVVLASAFYNQSQYIKALEYYLKALPISEKYNDRKMMPQVYNNMANIYKDLDNYSRSYNYRLKALKIYKEDDYKYGIAALLSNTGYDLMNMQDTALERIHYTHKQRVDTTLAYFRLAMVIFAKIDMPVGTASVLGNMGLLFNQLGRYDTALVCQQRSYEFFKQAGSKLDMAGSLGDMALVYRNIKNYAMSVKTGLEAKKLAEEAGNRFALTEIYMNLYYSYKALHKPELALLYHEKWKIVNDSMKGEDEQRALTLKSLQYEFGKRAAADSVKGAEEKKVKDAEIKAQQIQLKQEKTQRYFLFAGVALLLVFGVFMYNRFKVTQKQRNIITQQKEETDRQKHIIEEKQKEILDSIYYARRIQRSLLPNEKYIERVLIHLQKK